MVRMFVATAFVALFSLSTALRATNRIKVPIAVAAPQAAPTQKDVDAQRKKLETMAAMLGKMLHSDLSHSKVAPALKLFADNLVSVLNVSKSMKPADAMQKLTAATAGVAGLVRSLTKQQESLMREDFEQRESLLMGVLMSKKNAPMDEQLLVLENDNFEGLDVSRDLLKTHDNKTALYEQAARYLDTHKKAGGVLSHSAAKSHLETTAAAFDKRAESLEHDAKIRLIRHKKKIERLTSLAKKTKGLDATKLKAMIKREDHLYKKSAARAQQDIASMKEAAKAFRTGDQKALNHARAALQKSLDALKHSNGAMIVFLQEANSFLEKDCPYCAAQCIDKCHNNGDSYVTCMSECATVGKS